MTSVSVRELLLAYTRLGIDHWQKRSGLARDYEKAIGVDIASTIWRAEQIVISPFIANSSAIDSFKLLPMPCANHRIDAAFFAPWRDSSDSMDLSFDLVVLTQSESIFAFRFERPNGDENGNHEYDHVQLSQALGRKNVPLTHSIDRLPISYPAFPIPSHCPLTRFLALAITMHGFPNDINEIFERAFKGEGAISKKYVQMAYELVAREDLLQA